MVGVKHDMCRTSQATGEIQVWIIQIKLWALSMLNTTLRWFAQECQIYTQLLKKAKIVIAVNSRWQKPSLPQLSLPSGSHLATVSLLSRWLIVILVTVNWLQTKYWLFIGSSLLANGGNGKRLSQASQASHVVWVEWIALADKWSPNQRSWL